jgi:addiction module HigA family antidote
MTNYPANPMPAFEPPHPGEFLREDILPALKMSVKDAAAALGVSRQLLHKVLAGTVGVSPEMALRLGKFCGNGPDIWLGRQQTYDLWHAARALKKEIEKIPTQRAA